MLRVAQHLRERFSNHGWFTCHNRGWSEVAVLALVYRQVQQSVWFTIRAEISIQ